MTNTKKRAKLAGSNPVTQRELVARLELLGCEVRMTGRHLGIWVDGAFRHAIASTPSCSRSVLNTVSDLRRRGIDVRRMTVGPIPS